MSTMDRYTHEEQRPKRNRSDDLDHDDESVETTTIPTPKKRRSDQSTNKTKKWGIKKPNSATANVSNNTNNVSTIRKCNNNDNDDDDNTVVTHSKKPRRTARLTKKAKKPMTTTTITTSVVSSSKPPQGRKRCSNNADNDEQPSMAAPVASKKLRHTPTTLEDIIHRSNITATNNTIRTINAIDITDDDDDDDDENIDVLAPPKPAPSISEDEDEDDDDEELVEVIPPPQPSAPTSKVGVRVTPLSIPKPPTATEVIAGVARRCGNFVLQGLRRGLNWILKRLLMVALVELVALAFSTVDVATDLSHRRDARDFGAEVFQKIKTLHVIFLCVFWAYWILWLSYRVVCAYIRAFFLWLSATIMSCMLWAMIFVSFIFSMIIVLVHYS